ncbi:MAG: UDP binding domain-containing protein, partial [Roseobacter sp.]
IRNTKVVDVITELQDYGVRVDVHDPWVHTDEAMSEYGLSLIDSPEPESYDAIILAVSHDTFQAEGVQGIRRYGRETHVLYDLKYLFPAKDTDLRL